ncbi:hypothetical protein M0R72_17330 [Candidatus Pacearchaeota archaeon]|jgi:hypothetical protein|nr:hypothetical protein [Candidatus Pacearchaeota archaeon]
MKEPNGSITISATSGGGSPRKLNFNCRRVAGTFHNSMSLAILDHNGKYLADVVLNSNDIREIITEIARLL